MKFAPKSMAIHDKNNKRYDMYTFHSLDESEAKTISNEMYIMFKMVQDYCSNMTQEQKHYIECLNQMCEFADNSYSTTRKYYLESEVFEMANAKYVELYSLNPPKISFDGLYLITNEDRYQHLLQQIMYSDNTISVLRDRLPRLTTNKVLTDWYMQQNIIDPAKHEICHLDSHKKTCDEYQLDDHQRSNLVGSIARRVTLLEQIILSCEHYPKFHPQSESIKKELEFRNLPTLNVVTREHIMKYFINTKIQQDTQQFGRGRLHYHRVLERYGNPYHYRHNRINYHDDDFYNEDDYDNYDYISGCVYGYGHDPRVVDDEQMRKKIVNRILTSDYANQLTDSEIIRTFQEMKCNPDKVRNWIGVKLSHGVMLEPDLQSFSHFTQDNTQHVAQVNITCNGNNIISKFINWIGKLWKS
jgi:hypothetical protein